MYNKRLKHYISKDVDIFVITPAGVHTFAVRVEIRCVLCILNLVDKLMRTFLQILLNLVRSIYQDIDTTHYFISLCTEKHSNQKMSSIYSGILVKSLDHLFTLETKVRSDI